MTVPMIKMNGKMVPAKKVDGKWVPDEGSVLVYNKKGELEVKKGGESHGKKETSGKKEETDDEL